MIVMRVFLLLAKSHIFPDLFILLSALLALATNKRGIMRNFFLSVFMLVSWVVGAQEYKTVRIEIPTDMQSDSYHVESLGSRGVLIFYASNEVDKEGKRNWYFGLFGTALRQQWLKFVALNDPVEFVQARMNGGRMHLLFRNTGKTKFDYDFYEIVTYDSKNEAFSVISGSIPEKSKIAGFDVIDNTACLALNLRKYASDMVFINLISGDVVPVHVSEGNQSIITKLQADVKSKRYFLALKEVSDGRYLHDKIFIYTVKGALQSELKVENSQNVRMLKDVEFFTSSTSQLVILGTYDMMSGRMASLKDFEDNEEAKTAGFFFLKFVNNQQTVLNFYDFVAFKNINGTMESREIVNTRTINDSTGEREKQKVVTAFLHLSKPTGLEYNGQYFLSAEVYKPHYRTETRMDYDYYGRPYPYTYSVFAGYSYNDIIVGSFSEEGLLLWENELVMSDLISYKLNPHVVMVPDENTLTLGYVNNGKLISKTFEDGTDVVASNVPVAAMFTRDRIITDDDNVLIHWYDQYYLMYGEQTIRNRALGEEDERTVFYVNKVAFQ